MIFDNAYFIFGGPTLPSKTNGIASESAVAQSTSESADTRPLLLQNIFWNFCLLDHALYLTDIAFNLSWIGPNGLSIKQG